MLKELVVTLQSIKDYGFWTQLWSRRTESYATCRKFQLLIGCRCKSDLQCIKYLRVTRAVLCCCTMTISPPLAVLSVHFQYISRRAWSSVRHNKMCIDQFETKWDISSKLHEVWLALLLAKNVVQENRNKRPKAMICLSFSTICRPWLFRILI